MVDDIPLIRRHHNLLAVDGIPNITGPVQKGGKGRGAGGGNGKGGSTVGKGHGKGNGSGGSVTQTGTLLTPQTDQTGTIAFASGSEIYDVTGWHDVSTNNSRITIPSGVSLVRVWGNIFNGVTTNNLRGNITKNGSNAYGIGGNNQSQISGGAAPVAQNFAGAPIEVTAGDYFEMVAADGNAVTGNTSWFAAEVIDAASKGALVRKTSNQSLTHITPAFINWDAEVYDENGYHDNVTNNTRITIPEDGTYRVSASVALNANVGHFITDLFVNGSTVPGLVGPTGGAASGVAERFSYISAPMELTAGQYIEVRAYYDLGSSIQIVADERTWFAIEKVPDTYKRCLLKQSGAQSISSTTSNLQWGIEVYDADNMFDSGTSTTDIVIPSGVTQARVSMSLHTAATNANISISAKIEGSYFTGTGGAISDVLHGSYGDKCGFMSAWVDVTPGDVVTVDAYANSAGLNTNPSDYTWVCVECR